MPDNVSDRTIIHPLEKPIAADINQAQSQLDRTLREVFYRLMAARSSASSDAEAPSSGFIANGLRVRAESPASMNVVVKAGIGFIDDATDTPAAIDGVIGLDDLSSYKPIILMADQTFAVPAAPAGPNTRIDIIEVRTNRLVGDPQSRQILDPLTGAFSPDSRNKILSFVLDGSVGSVTSPADSTEALSYKVGSPANPGLVPATTTGYTKIAEVYVGSAVVVINPTELTDRRVLLAPGGVVRASAAFRLQYNAGTPIITTRFVNAPPGVMVGLYAPGPGATRGEFHVYVTGGEIAGASMIVTATPVAPGVAESVAAFFDSNYPEVIDTAGASGGNLEGSTPSIEAGEGTQAAHGIVKCRYQNNGTTNNTNALLENLYINVQVDLSY